MIEIITKTGDIISYHSILALIPDYDLAVTLLVAGPGGPGEANGQTMTLMLSQAIQALLPAIEKAGKAETKAMYAGRYTDKATNSSITLSLNDDGPGVSLSHFIMRGVDVPATDPGGSLPPTTPPTLDPPMRYRLYPTSADSDTQTSWRAVGTQATAEQVAEQDALFAWKMNSCTTWAALDRVTFNMGARDHFVFDIKDGKIKGVEAVGYGVYLKKESKGCK